MSFIVIALEELNDFLEENLRYNAISSRVAQATEEDFVEFMKDKKETNSKPLEIDHEAQMRQFMQG